MPNRRAIKNRPPTSLRLVGSEPPASASDVPRETLPDEPKLALETPPPPDWLPAGAAEIWREKIILLVQKRIWSPLFEPALSSFACLYAEFKADPVALSASKLVQMRLFAGDLGFSPAHIDRVRGE